MKATTTLLELVTAVTDEAESEDEVIATVVHLVNSGAVSLCGIRSALIQAARCPRCIPSHSEVCT